MASRLTNLTTRGSRIRKLLAAETKSLRKANTKKTPGYGKLTTIINKQKYRRWGMNPGNSYAHKKTSL